MKLTWSEMSPFVITSCVAVILALAVARTTQNFNKLYKTANAPAKETNP
ncbi:MAG: hypothetical protein P4L67_04415 [Candidatus Pacebacteria bacterium]|nr:hypothetical protein [Candidatus Paceibacterota bacterium]